MVLIVPVPSHCILYDINCFSWALIIKLKNIYINRCIDTISKYEVLVPCSVN